MPEDETEFERVWDVLGIGLVITGAASYLLVFAGANPVFDTFSTMNITAHVLAVGLGFVLAEGGTRQLVEKVFETIHD